MNGGGVLKTRYPLPSEDVEITRMLVAATCVVMDESGRVLMQKRTDNGMWGLPGGGVDPGESVEAAAVREAMEETGVRVRAVGVMGVDSGRDRMQVVHYPDGNVVHYVAVTVACEPIGEDGAGGGFDGETEEIGWFELGLDEGGGLEGVPGGRDMVVPPHLVRLESWLSERRAGRAGGGAGAGGGEAGGYDRWGVPMIELR